MKYFCILFFMFYSLFATADTAVCFRIISFIRSGTFSEGQFLNVAENNLPANLYPFVEELPEDASLEDLESLIKTHIKKSTSRNTVIAEADGVSLEAAFFQDKTYQDKKQKIFDIPGLRLSRKLFLMVGVDDNALRPDFRKNAFGDYLEKMNQAKKDNNFEYLKVLHNKVENNKMAFSLEKRNIAKNIFDKYSSEIKQKEAGDKEENERIRLAGVFKQLRRPDPLPYGNYQDKKEYFVREMINAVRTNSPYLNQYPEAFALLFPDEIAVEKQLNDIVQLVNNCSYIFSNLLSSLSQNNIDWFDRIFENQAHISEPQILDWENLKRVAHKIVSQEHAELIHFCSRALQLKSFMDIGNYHVDLQPIMTAVRVELGESPFESRVTWLLDRFDRSLQAFNSIPAMMAGVSLFQKYCRRGFFKEADQLALNLENHPYFQAAKADRQTFGFLFSLEGADYRKVEEVKAQLMNLTGQDFSELVAEFCIYFHYKNKLLDIIINYPFCHPRQLIFEARSALASFPRRLEMFNEFAQSITGMNR